jgi:hypothetical protein
MVMNAREIWTVIHGMVFGFIFLLGFSGALNAVYSLKPEWQTAEGIAKTVHGGDVSVALDQGLGFNAPIRHGVPFLNGYLI